MCSPLFGCYLLMLTGLGNPAPAALWKYSLPATPGTWSYRITAKVEQALTGSRPAHSLPSTALGRGRPCALHPTNLGLPKGGGVGEG